MDSAYVLIVYTDGKLADEMLKNIIFNKMKN